MLARGRRIAGFLKSAGLKSIDEAKVEKDPKKGDFYVAIVEKPGRAAIEVVAEIVPDIVRISPGRNRCAGACNRRSRARSIGCARCIPSLRPSVRKPKTPR